MQEVSLKLYANLKNVFFCCPLASAALFWDKRTNKIDSYYEMESVGLWDGSQNYNDTDPVTIKMHLRKDTNAHQYERLYSHHCLRVTGY